MTTQPSESAAGPAELVDARFLGELREQMLRFATQQLGDVSQAEDAVQEALAGALRNQHKFGNRSAVKTWVFGILKYKIIDQLRLKQRTIGVSDLIAVDSETEAFDTLFNARGGWQPGARPARWAEPEAAAQDDNFWRVFQLCLDNLPGQQGRAFMMREFIELDSQEICEVLAINLNNLNVLLYRARSRLRTCLERNWFMSESAS